MYLHLGHNTVVKTDELLGIFDLDSCTVDLRGREFLSNAEKQNRVINVSDGLPKSFVITEKGSVCVYISQLSSATLLKRTQNKYKLIGK